MIIFSLVTLLLIYISLAIFFGSHLKEAQERNINLIGILIAIAMTPTILTIYAWGLLSINFMPNFLVEFCIIPPIFFSLIIFFRNSYIFNNTKKLNINTFSNHPKISKKITYSFTVLILLIPFAIFLFSIYNQTKIHHIDNDINVYLNEASLLMNSLFKGLSIYEYFSEFAIQHPHSKSYSIYLSWGFIASSLDYFGSDLVPKIQVGLNHIAALSGALVLCFINRKFKFIWLIAAIVILLCCGVWEYQLRALSRDTYFLAPFFVLIALLIQAKPYKKFNKAQCIFILIIFLSLFSTLWGHSLGIFYAGIGVIAIGVMHSIKYRLKVFSIFELWIVTISLSMWSFYIIYKYFYVGSAELGFAFPHYADLALQENLLNSRGWMSPPSFFQLIKKIFINNTFTLEMVFLNLIGGSIILYKYLQKISITNSEHKWISLISIIFFTLLSIMYAPIKLEQIHFSSSFFVNLRYGFGLGLIFLILTVISIQIIFDQIKISNKFNINLLRYVFILILILIFSQVSFIRSKNFIKQSIDNESIRSNMLNSYCENLTSNGVRNIALDKRGFLNICKTNSFYLFTYKGEEVISSRNDEEFKSALNDEEIDVVILSLPLRYWKNVRLYEYLEKNWKQCVINNNDKVFFRPTYKSTVFCQKY